MNVPLFLAGLLALVASAVHGVAGERLVVRRLVESSLPPTHFGGPAMTESMLRASWHITTLAFLAVGVGMIVSASALDGDAAEAVAVFSAAAFTSFAALVAVIGGAKNAPRALLRHPGPLILSATAALAWWGAV